jgi:hypothetical protein
MSATPRSLSAVDAGQDNNLPISGGSGQPAADAAIGPSGGLRRAARWELLRCRKRLAHDVRKQSRRLTKNMMVTQDDIDAAWAKVVILPPAAAPVQRRTLRIRRVVAAVTVAAALFLAFLLGRTSLPAGQYWPALALIAAPFIVYRVLSWHSTCQPPRTSWHHTGHS